MADPAILDDYRNLRSQAQDPDAKTTTLKDGDGDGTLPPMSDRLSKLEGQQEGLKQAQNVLLTAVGLVSAILIGGGIYLFQKLDTQVSQVGSRVDLLSQKVDDLPGKISSDIRETNRAFAEALSAAKIQPPTVIYMDRNPSAQVPTKGQ